MLEFAVTLPLFLLLLFALIDFSRLLFTYISLTNGTRELARTMSISQTWNNTASATAALNAAFDNYTIIAGGQSPSTDKVTILTGDAKCARNQDTGSACSPAPVATVCTFQQLYGATCALGGSTKAPPQGGFVEVQTAYTFNFNPLFQTRLDGIIDVSFMRPTAVLTTTARAYVE
jgi:Flp pilus assembly protein TadG